MMTGTTTLVDSTKGLKFTESPRWHHGKLWFIDIHDKRVKTVDLSGSVATELELPFIPNAFGLAPDGSVVVGDAFQRRIYRRTEGTLQQVADISNLTTFCLSDGIVDTRGRLGTHAYAVMLGGPERKHLFICASGSHDPAEIQRKPSACLRVVEVDVPGAGTP